MDTLETHRARIASELANLHGKDLLDGFTDILARQAQEISELRAMIGLLSAYEANREVLLEVSDPVRARHPQMATSYELSADEHFAFSDGNHPIEFDKAGRPFRWCGKSGALVFSPFVDRSADKTVIIESFNTVAPENYSDFKLLDGKDELKAVFTQTTKIGGMIAATLPARKSGEPGTVLTLQLPVTRQLSEKDARVAAIAFHRCSITPVVEVAP
ncbi:MAG: hypothetical protein AB8B51_06015 [Sedimentitalea sp.]